MERFGRCETNSQHYLHSSRPDPPVGASFFFRQAPAEVEKQFISRSRRGEQMCLKYGKSNVIYNYPYHSDIKFQTRNRIQVRWKSRVSGRVGDRESKREFSRFGFPCCFRASSAVGFFTQCCLRFAPAAFNHTSLPLPPCILHYMQPRKKSCSRSVHEAASAFKRPYDILSF